MKRRRQFSFIPVHRCLHPAGSATAAADRRKPSSLAEKLGLKPIAPARVGFGKVPARKTDYLERWRNSPRFPVSRPDSPLELMLMAAIAQNHPTSFYYHGGSTPGVKRTVYPAEVFTVGLGDVLYVSGWCMNQQAHRTFRIDRIRLVG